MQIQLHPILSAEQMFAHGHKMQECATQYEKMPNGVRKGNHAVAFEKDDTTNVNSATQGDFVDTRMIFLLKKKMDKIIKI